MPVRKELGNALWLYLHCLAQLAERNGQTKFYLPVEKATANLLPCPKCKSHYKQNRRLGDYQALSGNLARLNFIHNQVNRLYRRPSLTDAESISRWQSETENLLLVKNTFYKIALTYATYWNARGWNESLKNQFKVMVEGTYTILNHNTRAPSPDLPENFYQEDTLYKLFQSQQMSSKIKKGFSYNTAGCNCHNR